MDALTEIWTIGHSNTSESHFVDLLTTHRIDAIADVRRYPVSRYCDHFSQTPLRRTLRGAGIDYVHLGEELGGDPAWRSWSDADWERHYESLAGDESFESGLQRLVNGAASRRIAIMCSEEDPTRCHRHLLVARALESQMGPLKVTHIRGDGSLISEAQLQKKTTPAAQQLEFSEAT